MKRKAGLGWKPRHMRSGSGRFRSSPPNGFSPPRPPCCALCGLCVRTLFVFALLGLMSAGGGGEGPRWEGFGPSGGGWIEDVVAHPTNPNEAWCLTDLSGLFRTRDGGRTWVKMSAAIEHALLARKQITSFNRCFAIDPRDPQHMYWGVYGMVWASHDGGETWERAFGEVPAFGDDRALRRTMTVAVAYDGTVYCLDGDLTLRASADHGRTWRELGRPPVKVASSQTPPFPVAAPDGTLYVSGRSPEGLAASRDGGKTWSLKLAGHAILNAKFAIDGRTRPRTLFAFAADGKLFRTDDGGETFKEVVTARHRWTPGLRFAGGLAVSNSGVVMLWAAGEQKISRDWGETWQPFSITRNWRMGTYPGMNRWESPEGKCSNLAVSCDGKTWYKCDSSLMAVSRDEGASWTGSTTGIQILCYHNGPAVARENPDHVFVGAFDQGLFETADGGKTWKAVNLRPEFWNANWENHQVTTVVQHPKNSATFFCVWHPSSEPRNSLLFRSSDGGKAWFLAFEPYKKLGGRAEEQYSRIVFDPTNPDVMHYSDWGLGVMTSRDGGKSWALGLKATNGVDLAVSPSGKSVYLQCWKKHGLWASHDRGESWKLVRPGDVGGLAHHPKDEDTLFITTGQHENYWDHKGQRPGTLWKSADAGETWQDLGRYDGAALYIDPVRPDVMLMSTLAGGKGILRSLDGGKSWQPFMAGAPSYTCWGFTYGGRPGWVYYWNYGNIARCTRLYEPGSGER